MTVIELETRDGDYRSRSFNAFEKRITQAWDADFAVVWLLANTWLASLKPPADALMRLRQEVYQATKKNFQKPRPEGLFQTLRELFKEEKLEEFA